MREGMAVTCHECMHRARLRLCQRAAADARCSDKSCTEVCHSLQCKASLTALKRWTAAAPVATRRAFSCGRAHMDGCYSKVKA